MALVSGRRGGAGVDIGMMNLGDSEPNLLWIVVFIKLIYFGQKTNLFTR